MKNTLILIFILVGAFCASAADDPAKAKTHQGVWKPIAASMLGKRVPKVELDKITVTIDAGKYVVTVDGEDHDDKGTFTIDTSTTPNRMTLKSNEGPNKGKTMLAIFEHKNSNSMRVCYDLSGKNFPKDFRTRKGTSLYAVGYRRKKN